MTGMALQFIDQSTTGIGAFERRIIRSHVMRGKNAGRPRQSTRKQTNIAHIKRVIAYPSILGPGGSKPRPLLWSDLCLTRFPQELDSESTKLMHRWFFDISDELFPPQFCSKFDIVKSIWVNCVLADEAYFHSTLAISGSYVDFFERKPGISSKTLYHISKAYALVNLKLSSPNSVSDSAIAAVITLTIYQQVHCQHSTGFIHLKGLHRMIQLRGGITALMKENRTLALKALRLDAELALQNGSPLYRIDDIPLRLIPGNSQATKEHFLSTAPILSYIALAVISFANILNDKEGEGRPKLDPLTYTETLIALLYHLIKVAPLRQPHSLSDKFYDEVLHLAMLAFMTTLLPEYGRDHSHSNYPLLSERLESAIHDLHITSIGNQDGGLSLLLWTLFIGGVSVLKLKNHQWLSSLILETCERLNLYDWTAVRHQLCGFPWIHSLHDGRGRCLLEDSRRKRMAFLQIEG